MANNETYDLLLSMGIDGALAREAAKRYDDRVEAAVEWCFGSGIDWKPDANPPAAPIAAPASSAPQMHHSHLEFQPPRPVDSIRFPAPHAAPTLPPRRTSPLPPPRPLGSNNPFYNADRASSELSSPTSTPPPPATAHSANAGADTDAAAGLEVTMQDEDDRELQEAIRLSQSQGNVEGETDGARVTVQPAQDIDMGDSGEETQRTERERSMRATAPPPSPREAGSALPSYGPSNKDEQGQTAMVPFTDTNNVSKEEEDINRAIEASLMTASMNSLPPLDQPPKLPRQAGAPLVFYSESNRQTYAANFLQALHAVPQLRRVVLESVADGIQPSYLTMPLKDLSRLFQLAETDEESYQHVDEIIKDIVMPTQDRSATSQLPPKPLLQVFIDKMAHAMEELAINTIERNNPNIIDISEDPAQLMYTETDPALTPRPAHVTFDRAFSLPSNMHAHLANVLWWQDAEDASGDAASGSGRPTSLVALPDMLCVLLTWAYGAKREVWELEEEITLDRYMKENQVWATQLRAQQSVARGTAGRLKEQLEALTMHKGYDFHESMTRLIANCDRDDPEADAERVQSRAALKAKLEQTLATFKEKTEKLRETMKIEEEKASSKLFETDDPDKNKHVYTLRAVLMHDGALVPGRHLYAYVKADDDKWWKIQDHEINPTTWDEMVGDRTGLFMDGGAYCFRKGPRPGAPPRLAEEDVTVEQEQDRELPGDQASAGEAQSETHMIPFPQHTEVADQEGEGVIAAPVDTAAVETPLDDAPEVEEESLIDLGSDSEGGTARTG